MPNIAQAGLYAPSRSRKTQSVNALCAIFRSPILSAQCFASQSTGPDCKKYGNQPERYMYTALAMGMTIAYRQK
jgi:hypothetical protein